MAALPQDGNALLAIEESPEVHFLLTNQVVIDLLKNRVSSYVMRDRAELSEEEVKQLVVRRRRWFAEATCRQSADRPTAEQGLAGLYEANGLDVPKFEWTSSPSAMVAAAGQFKDAENAGIWSSPPDGFSRRAWMAALDAAIHAALPATLLRYLRSLLLHPLRILRVTSDFHHGGQHESYWIALYTYCRDVLGVPFAPPADRRLRSWEQIAGSCGWFIPLKGRVVVADRPEAQILDSERRRLHCEDGPALRFRDGSGLGCLEGLCADEKLVRFPHLQTPEEIRRETDPQLKGLRIARFAGFATFPARGLARYLTQNEAQILDQRRVPLGNLAELLIRTRDGETMLIEHHCDANRIYAFPVGPELTTCDAARAHATSEEILPPPSVPHKVKFADPIPLNLVGELDAGVPILHPWRVFLSVLPVDDGYIGVVREFKIPRSANETHLFALRLNSRGAPIGDPVNLGTGEDPRLFIHNGRFFALSWQPRYSNGIADINQFVVDLQTGSRISLSHDLNYGGKNWMPVMGHSSLWIIRSIVPLVILEADPATGRCTTVLSWGDEEITEFRGGGAAWRRGDKIIGFGHRTRNKDWHTPFQFTISLHDASVEIRDAALPEKWNHSVVDPTSFWGDRLVCCRTAKRWEAVQPVEHGIFRVG